MNIKCIATGCNILGSGGGGYTFPITIGLWRMIRNDSIRVVDSRNIDDEAFARGTRFGGAPSLFSKRLPTNELFEAEGGLLRLLKDRVTHPIAWKSEVGGTNSMQLLWLLPDRTLICRPSIAATVVAHPRAGDRQLVYLPMMLSHSNGALVISCQAKSDKGVEGLLRAAPHRTHLYNECVMEGEGGGSCNSHSVIPFKK